MSTKSIETFEIRKAEPEEYETLGRMTVEAYEELPGMPSRQEQKEYYGMLFDVAARASMPSIEILVAVAPDMEILGGVTFVGDMRYYKSGGTAGSVANASGIRLLAVKPEARRFGVGKALTNACIRKTKMIGKAQVILHTTKSMETAWRMYESMEFKRSPDLDFQQGSLAVFGFSKIIA